MADIRNARDADYIDELEARLSAHEETIRNQRAHAQKLEERAKQVDSLFSRNCKLSEEKRDLEARLAMVTEAARRYRQRFGINGRLTDADCDAIQGLNAALESSTPTVAAFLARVKRQGAAEALRALHVRLLPDGMPYKPKYPYELTHILDEAIRAAELEREV